MDFIIDGLPPYKYADVKTPIKPVYNSITEQMQKIITKIRVYDKDVLGIIDLKNLNALEKIEAMKVIDGATDLTNIAVLNK